MWNEYTLQEQIEELSNNLFIIGKQKRYIYFVDDELEEGEMTSCIGMNSQQVIKLKAFINELLNINVNDEEDIEIHLSKDNHMGWFNLYKYGERNDSRR